MFVLPTEQVTFINPIFHRNSLEWRLLDQGFKAGINVNSSIYRHLVDVWYHCIHCINDLDTDLAECFDFFFKDWVILSNI